MVSSIGNLPSLPDIKGTPRLSEAEVARLIDQYVQNIVTSAVQPPHFGDLLHFFKLVQNVAWSRQNYENVPEDKRLLIMVDDPPDEEKVDTEAITYVLERRKPGVFGRIAAGDSGTGAPREVTPHCRSVQEHPEHPGEKLVTMGRFFDNVIVFNIYARTNLQVMKRILWFEDVMDTYSWYFRLHGTRAVIQDTWRVGLVDIGELSMVKYSMSFFVRTEDTYQFGLQELRRLVLNLDVSNYNDEED